MQSRLAAVTARLAQIAAWSTPTAAQLQVGWLIGWLVGWLAQILEKKVGWLVACLLAGSRRLLSLLQVCFAAETVSAPMSRLSRGWLAQTLENKVGWMDGWLVGWLVPQNNMQRTGSTSVVVE